MTDLIPMTSSFGVAWAMKKNIIPTRVLPKHRRQIQNLEPLALPQGFDTLIGIEEAANAKTFHIFPASSGIGINLNSRTPRNHQKLCSSGLHLIAHPHDQSFGHSPGVVPLRIDGFAKNFAIQPRLAVGTDRPKLLFSVAKLKRFAGCINQPQYPQVIPDPIEGPANEGLL